MKRSLLLLIVAILVLPGCKQDNPSPSGTVPSDRQMAWHEMEYYMFIHFSVNTFTDKEWGFGDESPSLFNPSAMDVNQWAKVASDAGMKGIILTAKHHDGFCLWPSLYTSHSVKNSPYRNGQGDIIRELREACDRYGLKMGLYLSPWDRNHADYGSEKYLSYYRDQLRELLTSYGDIFEVWFDGANGGTGFYGGANEERSVERETYYDWHNTWEIVRELQPMAVMFSDAGPDVRWVGNENGLASPTNWCLLRRDEFYPGTSRSGELGEGHEDGDYWVPAEVDVSIRPGWFYHESQDSMVKSPAGLMDIYYASVGRNANLLLNVPPDRRGLINENDIESLMGFRSLREKEFTLDIAEGKQAKASSSRHRKSSGKMVTDGDNETFWTLPAGEMTGSVVINLGKPERVNRILLQEYIRLGQHVKGFRVEAFMEGEWYQIAEGTTIGYKIIRKFDAVTTDRIRVTITNSRACPAISTIELYSSPGD